MTQQVRASFKRQYFCAQMSLPESQTALLPSLRTALIITVATSFVVACGVIACINAGDARRIRSRSVELIIQHESTAKPLL